MTKKHDWKEKDMLWTYVGTYLEVTAQSLNKNITKKLNKYEERVVCWPS